VGPWRPLAQDLGIAGKGGNGDTCKQDNDFGEGVSCKKLRYECRYGNRCGREKDFCDANGDSCSGYRRNTKKNRSQRK
jgi:hypothetical protein